MKSARFIFVLLISALVFISAAVSVSAQYLTPDENPAQILSRADTDIFVKAPILTQDYAEHQGYTNEYIQTDTQNLVHEYFVYGGYATDMLFALDPAKESYRNPNIRLSFNTVWKPSFHVSLDFQKGDEEPENGGRCWIRYSDIVIAGKGNEKGMILYPGDKAYYFETVRGDVSYTEIADLSGVTLKRDPEFFRDPIPWSEGTDPVTDENGNWIGGSKSLFEGMDKFREEEIKPSGSHPDAYNHLDVIRVDGITFVYINGQFMFQYEDGIRNALSFDAGAEINEGGIYVECNFDNFSMRAL